MLQITLTPAEYQRIAPDMSVGERQLRGDWKQLLYDKFSVLCATCPIVFYYSHVQKLDSRKKGARFWHGKAACVDCISVDFYICSTPRVNENVIVEVQIHGHCTHVPVDGNPVVGRRGRRLQGSERVETGRLLTTHATTPTKTYYEKLSDMPSAAVAAGNVTQCKSPGVYRQAAYEYRLRQQLHPDMITELRLQRKDWAASERHGEPMGFIQNIGDTPFYCTFYLRQQIELYIEHCSSGCSVVHFDATGSVVRDIPDNKRVLYYCLIPAAVNVPVFEFISSQHTTETIGFLLDLFMRDVRTVNNGLTVKPQYVVTDFSDAILNACVQVYDKCTISSYLKVTVKVLQRQRSLDNINNITFVCLCVAHMIRCMSRKFTRVAPGKKDKQRRQYALTLFAVLARTTSLEKALEVYRHIVVMLRTTARTASVINSERFMSQLLTAAHEDVQPAANLTGLLTYHL